jgi:hypothetical protein
MESTQADTDIQSDALHKISVKCFRKYKTLVNCVQEKGFFKQCPIEQNDYTTCLQSEFESSKINGINDLAQFISTEVTDAFDKFDDILMTSPRSSFLPSCVSKILIFNHLNQYGWLNNKDTQPTVLKYLRRLHVCRLNVDNNSTKLKEWTLCFDHAFGQKRFYYSDEFREKYEKCAHLLE